ncbi:Piso0_001773 [Millerozyma farinosa CBS 7064]|uniref:Piso0_001773 protein n=1 Tax=Pichia sorbitophila (strain ATCC MYA-4447 / BCRC 22081 / CBS 7064 / NBRC 10061 / NRRL Y-12695) TaxID=559304 RepID=G8YP21_PICSO|nr:Piso0_001773 [Millerozyma farinosa CBS 7064]
MYRAPNRQGATSYASTSSSVYTPVESKFRFSSGNMVEEHVSEEEELGNEFASESMASTNSSENANYLGAENSFQTIDTYMTAAGSAGTLNSFSSITESIMNNKSPNDTMAYDQTADTAYDNDATPKFHNDFQNDPIDDRTPKLNGEEQFLQNIDDMDMSGKRASTLLPQQELSSKFKRLSTTLRQSAAFTSGDSVQFMDTFQQNIERAAFQDRNYSKSRSSYYTRIKDADAADTERDVDESSDARTVETNDSNRLSSISNDSTDLRRNDLDHGFQHILMSRNNSSTDADSVNSVDHNERSFVNFRGSRISPLKVVKNTSVQELTLDDIPLRKDLINKFEEMNIGAKKVSEKQKVDYVISKRRLETDESDSEGPQGLNISTTDSDVNRKSSRKSIESQRSSSHHSISDVQSYSHSLSSNFEMKTEDEDLSGLFIRALHPFDSSTLQLDSDASICLSFEKDDLAFVHTIDESGWGEVTLVESLQRGWIPMNYFTMVVSDDPSSDDQDAAEDSNFQGHSIYLKPLFRACGEFLINPLSHQARNGNYTFSTKVINSIRDGVRLLLQETDCLSRSNEIVTKKPIVRKIRKSLLADWYNLMVRANEYKGTSNFNKIEILTLMVFQVARKAVSFLQVWSIESSHIIKRENEKKLKNDMNTYPLLKTPPQAKQRVTEINSLLYQYLGLIIGRLDMIEHNSEGCDILESLTHQIILLLRELLFISKTGTDFSLEKPAELDASLDNLLSLVSSLVSGVKVLVVKTMNESVEDQQRIMSVKGSKSTPDKDYLYTEEGGDLIQVATKMIRALSLTIFSIRKLLEITGDFKLHAERSYPDYAKMKIEPDEFIKKCSLGIMRHGQQKMKGKDSLAPPMKNKINRFSMVRSGKTGMLGLTPEGEGFLNEVLFDKDTSFSSNPEFEKFTTTTSKMEPIDLKKEILVDSQGNLLGASFKGLVYTLTNETATPEHFFVSTFFICFRYFANGIDLVEELISRFEVDRVSSNKDVGEDIRLKNRRRLIVKMFQIWLESYWNYNSDGPLLTTLINFFNEAVSFHLPIEAMRLLDICARLFSKPLTENSRDIKVRSSKQLVNRSITLKKSSRKNSSDSSLSDASLTARYSMVDGYELSRINTSSSATGTLKSMALPMPLGIGNQRPSSSSLLTKTEMSTIEKVNLTFRNIIGESWCPHTFINTKNYIPLPLSDILDRWYKVSEQSWVLSNYRPNLPDFNGLEIAKQLTLIESHIFCSISPNELLNENYTAKKAHLKLAPNIRKSILFTNSLSSYVLESLLQPNINPKMRANILKTWLKIAISCLYLRNFNSLAAIITSLQSHLVTRLTRLWEDLSEKYTELYNYLVGIVHPEKNYRVYREKLKNFLVSNEYNIPIVPYFLLFLQDLTFVTDGNPSYRNANSFLNQKVINIDKYLKITRIIADIESLQITYDIPAVASQTDKRRNSILIGIGGNKPPVSDEYNINAVPPLQELILLELWKITQLNKKEEDRAWKLSCTIQPRT